MSLINIDFGPQQKVISEESIREMVRLTPRRMKISSDFPDKYGIKAPYQEGADWSVWFPFEETYKNAFEAMCSVDRHVGVRVKENGRCFTFIRDTAFCAQPPEDIAECCSLLAKYVAIRDCLALSFALDYDHQEGNPSKPYSDVGRLRNLVKPRDGSFPSQKNFTTGGKGLAVKCLQFFKDMKFYRQADCVVAMPASTPDKPFYLPRNLAKIFARELDLSNLSEYVVTTKKRNQLKNATVEERLQLISGTVAVSNEVFQGKTIILIDDVYQSGTSMNYIAMLLQRAGAKKIFGLSCDKTCSNTDNLG